MTTTKTPRTHRVPTGTVQPSTTYKSFDLNEFIEALPSAYVRMHAAKSYAWRIDTLIVQACRSLFKEVRENLKVGGNDSLDTAADYNLALAEAEFAEFAFDEAGVVSAGPVRTLHEMLDLRAEAHTLAAEASSLVLDWSGKAMRYECPEIESLFSQTGTFKPKAATLARMKLTAERTAAKNATGKDVKAIAEKLFDAKKRREATRLAGMQENLQSQSGAVEMMFNIASKRRPDSLGVREVPFHRCDVETQRTLIASVKQTLQRAIDYAESDQNMSDDEFSGVLICADDATALLDKVLLSPKFNAGVDGNAPVKAIAPLKPEAIKPKTKAKRTPKTKVTVTPKVEPLPTPAPVVVPANIAIARWEHKSEWGSTYPIPYRSLPSKRPLPIWFSYSYRKHIFLFCSFLFSSTLK